MVSIWQGRKEVAGWISGESKEDAFIRSGLLVKESRVMFVINILEKRDVSFSSHALFGFVGIF